MVPAPMEELHEPYAPLDEAPGLQAVGRIGTALTGGFPIEFPGPLGLVAGSGNFGNRFLHAKGEFILRNARLELGVRGLFAA